MFKTLKTAWRRLRGVYPTEYGGEAECEELGPRAEGFHTALTDYTVWKATREGVAKCVLPKGTRYYVSRPSTVFPRGMGKTIVTKCRAEQLYVEQLYDYNGVSFFKSDANTHTSFHDMWFAYEAETHVRPDSSFSSRSRACDSGIHFFCSRQEAEAWHRDRTDDY